MPRVTTQTAIVPGDRTRMVIIMGIGYAPLGYYHCTGVVHVGLLWLSLVLPSIGSRLLARWLLRLR
eukprot:9792440-Lingulodinium_polyedra.AAC.1